MRNQISGSAQPGRPRRELLQPGSQTFLRHPPRLLVYASLRPQRAQLAVFSALPRLWYARRVRLAAPTCAPATFDGSRFLPVSERTRNWLTASRGLSNPKPYVPKPCGHDGDQVRSCPASPGPAISMEALNQESQRLSFGELSRLRPETNTATGPRVLSRAAFVFGS